MKKNFSACVFSYNGTSAKCINVEASPLLSPEGAPVPGAWTVPAAEIQAPTTVEHLDGSGKVAYVDCEKSQNFETVAVSTPEVQEYRLMYLFGAWVTKETIHAETDEEAIFDADAAFKESKTLHNWNGVALVQGNRFVKMYRPIREDDHGKLICYNIETVNGENRMIPVDPMD